jgi:hypothetical protein
MGFISDLLERDPGIPGVYTLPTLAASAFTNCPCLCASAFIG